MLIISSGIVFLISIITIIVFIKKSYIKNRLESLYLILAILGFNITCICINIYYANYGSSYYLLFKYVFFSKDLLDFFLIFDVSILKVSNLLNFGQFMFIFGMYFFIKSIVEKHFSIRNIILIIILLFFSMINSTYFYPSFVSFLKRLPLPYAKSIDLFDYIARTYTLLLLLELLIVLDRYSRKHRNTLGRKNAYLLMTGLSMIWIEFLFLFDLTPASLANIYASSIMINIVNDVLVSSFRNNMVLLFCIASVIIITVPFGILLYSSINILKHRNHEIIGRISINKKIHISDASNLNPFLHTIKNQLVSLTQFENLLNKDNFDEVYPYIVSITNDISKIIDNLYSNSKDIYLSILRCNVLIPLKESIKSINDLANINIELICPHHEIWAMVDPDYIYHAFENILQNSAEACAGKPDGKIKVTVHKYYHIVKIIISDNGIGIKKEDLKKVFEPFFSTKKSSQSWGMGLNYVVKIIKAHKGRVHVKSIPGVGTDMVITIPTGE